MGSEKGLGARKEPRTYCEGAASGREPTCHVQQVPREGEKSQRQIQGEV